MRTRTLKRPRPHGLGIRRAAPKEKRAGFARARFAAKRPNPKPTESASFRSDLVGNAEIRLLDVLVLLQLLRVVRECDPSRLEHVTAARDVERHQGVLLDEQD